MNKRRDIYHPPVYGLAPGAIYDPSILFLLPEPEIPREVKEGGQSIRELIAQEDTDATEPRIVVPNGYKNALPRECGSEVLS